MHDPDARLAESWQAYQDARALRAVAESQVAVRQEELAAALHELPGLGLGLLRADPEATIVSFDPNAIVREWNAGAEALFGYTAAQIVGEPLQDLITEGEVAAGNLQELEAKALSEGFGEGVLEAVDDEGTRFAMFVVMVPRWYGPGEAAGFTLIANELDLGVASRKALAETKHLLHNLLEEESQRAIITVDLDGTIDGWSESAQTLFGYDAAEAIGRGIDLVYAHDEFDPHLAATLAEGDATAELTAVLQDGTTLATDVSFTRIEDTDGVPTAVLLSVDESTPVLPPQFVEERKRIRAAQREAEATLRRQQENLGKLVHELRAPLINVGLHADIMREGADDTHLDAIRQNVDQLGLLVEDILTLQRYGHGALDIDRAPVSPAKLIEEMRRVMQVETQHRGVALTARVGNVPTQVPLDATRMKQVLYNLLFNAARFTPRGGSIDLHALADEGHLVIRVADTGCGIPEDELDDIFKPFVQASTNDRGDGTGLGLAIVKGIVEAHDGDVEVTSKLGAGTTFTIRIPVEVDIPGGQTVEAVVQ